MNYYILPKNNLVLKLNIVLNEKKLEPHICNSLYYYLDTPFIPSNNYCQII